MTVVIWLVTRPTAGPRFGARIMGTAFGAVAFASTLGMAIGPLAIALTFRPPRRLPAALASPSLAH